MKTIAKVKIDVAIYDRQPDVDGKKEIIIRQHVGTAEFTSNGKKFKVDLALTANYNALIVHTTTVNYQDSKDYVLSFESFLNGIEKLLVQDENKLNPVTEEPPRVKIAKGTRTLKAGDYVRVKETGGIFEVDYIVGSNVNGVSARYVLKGGGTNRRYRRHELHKLSAKEVKEYWAKIGKEKQG